MQDYVDFTYDESYPKAQSHNDVSTPAVNTFSQEDITYLQDHIRTFRAVQTASIDGLKGKYYDGAITLLDAFGFLLQAVSHRRRVIPTGCRVVIKPDAVTAITFDLDVFEVDADVHQVQVRLMYSNVGCAEGIPGFYLIQMTNMKTGKTITVGDAMYTAAVTAYEPGEEDMLCYIANANALRYCECFPSPCIFKTMCAMAWNVIHQSEDNDERDQ